MKKLEIIILAANISKIYDLKNAVKISLFFDYFSNDIDKYSI